MSTAQLRSYADKLSVRQRTYLRAYLTLKERIESEEYRTEMGRRIRAMKAGHYLTQTEVKDLLRRQERVGL